MQGDFVYFLLKRLTYTLLTLTTSRYIVYGAGIRKCATPVGNHKTSGQSYKQFSVVIYESRVVIWGIFMSGTTLES